AESNCTRSPPLPLSFCPSAAFGGVFSIIAHACALLPLCRFSRGYPSVCGNPLQWHPSSVRPAGRCTGQPTPPAPPPRNSGGFPHCRNCNTPPCLRQCPDGPPSPPRQCWPPKREIPCHIFPSAAGSSPLPCG